jgi:hypothetical protein
VVSFPGFLVEERAALVSLEKRACLGFSPIAQKCQTRASVQDILIACFPPNYLGCFLKWCGQLDRRDSCPHLQVCPRLQHTVLQLQLGTPILASGSIIGLDSFQVHHAHSAHHDGGDENKKLHKLDTNNIRTSSLLLSLLIPFAWLTGHMLTVHSAIWHACLTSETALAVSNDC